MDVSVCTYAHADLWKLALKTSSFLLLTCICFYNLDSYLISESKVIKKVNRANSYLVQSASSPAAAAAVGGISSWLKSESESVLLRKPSCELRALCLSCSRGVLLPSRPSLKLFPLLDKRPSVRRSDSTRQHYCPIALLSACQLDELRAIICFKLIPCFPLNYSFFLLFFKLTIPVSRHND